MPNDFNYNANTFSSYEEMLACLCNLMCGDYNLSSDYSKLLEIDESILKETFNEVHIRELKRFIRSKEVTRNKAVRLLLIVIYDGSLGAKKMMPLLELMIVYLISGENGNVYPKPSIPYDLLFDEFFNDTHTATLDDEIRGGGYNVRGMLIDIFAKYYLGFDATPYGDWANITSMTLDTHEPSYTKISSDDERLSYIKGYSDYLKGI